MRDLKIGYFADGKWAHFAINKILHDKSFRVAFICARFDSPDPVLKNIANEYNIDFIVNKDINSSEFISAIKLHECDIFISMSFNQIFKKRIIGLPAEGIINCHAGQLPFYRGRNILNWVLINDEKEFGITVHYVDEGIDTGDIIKQLTYPITDSDSYQTILEKAYEGCAIALYSALKDLQKNKVVRIKQKLIHPIGFYCSKRVPGDEIINWHSTAREIFNFIRALSEPGPVARSSCNGHEVLVKRAQIIDKAPTYKCIPGSILEKKADVLVVKALDSSIRLVDWNCNGSVKMGDRLK